MTPNGMNRRAFFSTMATVIAAGASSTQDRYVSVGKIARGSFLAQLVRGVTLDGVPLNHRRVIAADDRRGWVLMFVEYTEADGRAVLKVDPKHPGRLQKQLLRGQVRFTFAPRAEW